MSALLWILLTLAILLVAGLAVELYAKRGQRRPLSHSQPTARLGAKSPNGRTTEIN